MRAPAETAVPARGHARLALCPVSFATAAEFVAAHHRHLAPPVGHKFSIGAESGGAVVGVIMVGRPIARRFDDGRTLEVCRTATDGTPNVASMLLGAAWRAARALGYTRLITYTRADEPGSSLRAAGCRIVAHRSPRTGWDCRARPRQDRGTTNVARTLWEAGTS
ncbi:hypothetical protein IU476_06570 [Nocardia blacklockiae]|nr:hypothetical protein [Nocardia blacklockiae]